MAVVRIPARFNGPPDSGHGGYSCGVAADLLGAPAEVQLHAPPPLEIPLRVVEADDGIELHHGETLVARARPAPPPELRPPATIAPDVAARAVEGYRGFVDHPFPSCFVCGPQRPRGDGLRIFPGPTGEHAGVVAAPWTPPPWLAGDDGAVAPVFVWSALDCPSAYGSMAWLEAERPGEDPGVAVLASMRIRHEAPVPIGEELVVLGWGRDADGRKRHAASALQTATGEVLATAEALWIRLRGDEPTT